jgi:ParB/RepB/Spo0J family partition protein
VSEEIVLKPADWFKPMRGNRELGDLTWLKESIKQFSVLQPVGALPDGSLLFGHRRTAVCKELGILVPTRIFTDSLGAEEELLLSAQENQQRSQLTGYEQWARYEQFRQLKPELTDKEIAKRFAVDASTIVRWASPSSCIDSVVAALKENRIGISDAYVLSKVPREEQAAMLALRLGGSLTRDSLARQARSRRQPAQPPARLDRVKLVLPSGATVTIAGSGLDMDGVAEALNTALRETRKGKESGINVKTLAASMKDRAGQAPQSSS